MNIIILPFHDWRKSEAEGFRTRDVHFIKAFEKLENVQKILVINRPFTKLELILKKHRYRLKGEVLLENSKFQLTKVSNKIFVVDFQSSDVFGQIVKKHKWFLDKYDDEQYRDFILKAKDFLEINQATLLCQNIFSYKLVNNLEASKKIFDAWDNFLKFPAYLYLQKELEQAYNSMSKAVKYWLTNSNENIEFYKNQFHVKEIRLIKNGVNQDFLLHNNAFPQDLSEIPRPIIGFGGKISYLLDVDLINFITKENPNSSFVFVGQILDKKVYNKIIKRENIYFLGDRKYTVYPKYVNAFDIGIIPYHIEEKQHGGDSIKAYEYLLANKKAVGTRGNGLVELEKYLYLCNNKNEFSELLKCTKNEKESFPVSKYTWEERAIEILNT